MQIKNIELLELFQKTICHSSEAHQEQMLIRQQQTIADSDIEQPVTLEKLLGNRDSLIEHLADQYEANNLPELAHATRLIASVLVEDMLLFSNEQERPQRLLDYVYPVV